ncbi:DUF808 domain-containing protein [Kingella kingae]|uniref:DUF808 domain-containing protein n=1 Tax=Kingella kingae TaxID=504 RepID=UPI002556CAF9|nr:DUF808 domain-containing protein [Kingella kingae]MDK4623914.1 DUF808 domain-containing protein [Kingella kingae]MDK4659540.1 DUF808 domain-containing protein [Kingella kingae]MDK4667447.1 DUF808 domain-containing protein [Kingella kingae]MDK4685855.1 DUF808 domain-containing protein [Kingella kingae]
MAFASLFTLLDDIASVLDDVALMTKMAAKKTAGVVGDDLALNANQVTGVQADRELPIVWAVAKSSLINKVILIPIALLLSIFLPKLITPLLMIGGAYLCFEGVEKLLHKFLHQHEETHEATHIPDSLDSEKDKIKGAIRTDFILSAEIIIIALGVVQESKLMVKIFALSAVGIGITIFVYGLVAMIVKADDVGLYLMQAASSGKRAIGRMIIAIMPWVMRALAFVGTLAMFLVGGGIFTHNIDALHHIQWSNALIATGFDLVVGLVVGAICCAVILPLSKKLAAAK